MSQPRINTYDPPDEMTDLEQAVVSHLCGDDIELGVCEREYTGVGLYVWFASKLQKTEIISLPHIHIATNDSQAGLGLIAYTGPNAHNFEDAPVGLEFFSHGEAWWGKQSSFDITDNSDTQE